MKTKPSISSIGIIIIGIIMLLVSSNLNWGEGKWSTVLEADAKGYYAYLPAIFIYHDLSFSFYEEVEIEKYQNQHLYYDYRVESNGKTTNKYFCGTALLQSPFFFIAHGLSKLFNFDTDGYSKLYKIFISIAAIFYLLVGLLFLDKLMSYYGISNVTKLIVLLAMAFGTNVFYYSVVEVGMSHIYSFGIISMFLYYSKSLFEHFKPKYIPILFILYALLILTRPVNGIIILAIPFIAGSSQNIQITLERLFQHKKHLLFGLLVMFAILFIQPLIYKISTGNFFLYSYGSEGFNFANPHFIGILFSYKKGLFLYTPILLFSLFGCYYIYKRSRFEFFSYVGFLIILTYILSSWWNWWYGGSFSSRAFLEYIPLFAILLGLLLQNLKMKVLKYSSLGLVLIFIVICQIQIYQYRYYHIHWEDMTKEKYWDNFLRIDKIILS